LSYGPGIPIFSNRSILYQLPPTATTPDMIAPILRSISKAERLILMVQFLTGPVSSGLIK